MSISRTAIFRPSCNEIDRSPALEAKDFKSISVQKHEAFSGVPWDSNNFKNARVVESRSSMVFLQRGLSFYDFSMLLSPFRSTMAAVCAPCLGTRREYSRAKYLVYTCSPKDLCCATGDCVADCATLILGSTSRLGLHACPCQDAKQNHCPTHPSWSPANGNMKALIFFDSYLDS